MTNLKDRVMRAAKVPHNPDYSPASNCAIIRENARLTREVITPLVELCERMGEALEFYAQGENIYMNGMELTEGKFGGPLGTIARAALQRAKEWGGELVK